MTRTPRRRPPSDPGWAQLGWLGVAGVAAAVILGLRLDRAPTPPAPEQVPQPAPTTPWMAQVAPASPGATPPSWSHQDEALVASLAAAAGLDPALTAVLLAPEPLARAHARCPSSTPAAAAEVLCDPASLTAATRRVDDALGALLGSEDDRVALAAMEQAVRLERRGLDLGARILDGALPPCPRPGQQAARALSIRAALLDRPTAITALEGHLHPDDPLALIAALELGRLGAQAQRPALEDLADQLGASGEGILVRYAAALTAGAVPVDRPGL